MQSSEARGDRERGTDTSHGCSERGVTGGLPAGAAYPACLCKRLSAAPTWRTDRGGDWAEGSPLVLGTWAGVRAGDGESPMFAGCHVPPSGGLLKF